MWAIVLGREFMTRKIVIIYGSSETNSSIVRKKYGAIPGVEVGTWWDTRWRAFDAFFSATNFKFGRAGCSTDAIHAPFVAGIAGSAIQGAYSVALSGGYDDDVDLGYALSVICLFLYDL